jgi:hypothetical protein
MKIKNDLFEYLESNEIPEDYMVLVNEEGEYFHVPAEMPVGEESPEIATERRYRCQVVATNNPIARGLARAYSILPGKDPGFDD